MSRTHRTAQPFTGFSSPNFTQVPDELFDLLMPQLTEAELRVLLYIIRRTFGFKKTSDDISLNQLVDGIRSRDGTALDHGAGVGKTAAVRAVKGLVAKGVIAAQRNQSAEKGYEATTYSLRFQEETLVHQRNKGACSPKEQALVHEGNIQETVVQETDGRPSNFERSHDEKKTNRRERRNERAVGDSVGESTKRFMPLGDIVKLRQQSVAKIGRTLDGEEEQAAAAPLMHRRRGRPPGAGDDREHLGAYLKDFCQELGDESSLSSAITRAYNIFAAAKIPVSQWSDYLYRARATTQEHTAQIKKRASDGGSGVRQKNKMPYFYAVLSELCGLRSPEDNEQVQLSEHAR